MARLTGLEPATPGVTGRYSNQLSYNRSLHADPSVFAGDMRPHAGRQAPDAGIFENIQKFLPLMP